MSDTTETPHLFYSRPGSSTPPTTSLQLPTRPQHTRPPLSLPSSLSLSPGPSGTPSHPIFFSPALVDCDISLVETRLEQLDIHLTKINPFNAQRLHYTPSRYLVEFILDCDASNNTSPNWETALTILIRRHINQRKDASPAEVERYRRAVQILIDTACEPDVAIRLFRNEGIEEDVWAWGMTGETGHGGSISAVGSSGKRAKLPSYVDNLKEKSHQGDSDRIRAALADFSICKASSSVFSPPELQARLQTQQTRYRGRWLTQSRLLRAVMFLQLPTVLTSDSGGGDHSVQCDVTTPPTTLASSSPPSTSRTASKPRSKRAIRHHRKARTKPTPPELLGLDLELFDTYPTPNLLSQWKPHSPSSILSTPTPSSPTINVTPIAGTINRVSESEHAYYAPFSTLNATLCFMNPEERRRFDKRQINFGWRREVWGHVLRTVGPAEVRDE
ncbi:hypothetical protein FRC05_010070 [Tulasnella sp. 425]|nr:hypothetical protein FRC05_010070 [Tulasnella sp. 425]